MSSTMSNLSIAEQDHLIQQEVAGYPSLAPPPGVVIDFTHPYSKGYIIIIVSAILVPIVTLFMVLRTYTKALINVGGLGKEDYACLLSWAGFIIFNAFSLWLIPVGSGVHQWDVEAVEGMHFAQRANYVAIVYEPTIFFAKLALLLAILKIFAPNRGLNTGVFWVCHATILFNLVFYVIILFLRIFQCSPIAKIWDPFLPGKCHSGVTTLIVASAVNAATDFVLLIIPLVCVFKLQMSSQKKWGVSAIFACGLFSCVCSLLRTVDGVELARTEDLIYHLQDNLLWANGEVAGAIIASCMISLPQFIRHTWPKVASLASWIPNRWRTKSLSFGAAPVDKIAQRQPGPVASFPSDTETLRGDYIELEEANTGVDLSKDPIKSMATEVYQPR